ncbi:unnamed protein product [Closterium sp. NIES-54]
MIHAAVPLFLWPFAVRYASHQLDPWPCVPVPDTSPTLPWTGEVNDASAFRVWDALSLVRDTTAGKFGCTLLALSTASSLASPPTPRPGSFTTLPCAASCPHKTSPLTSQSTSTVPLIFSSPPAAPLPGPRSPLGRTLPPQGPAPSAEGHDPAADDTTATRRSPRLETPPGFPPRPPSPPPQPVAVDSGAVGGGVTGGADSGGAGPRVTNSRGAESGGAGSGGAASPSGGGVVGALAGGSSVGQQQHAGAWSTGAGGAGAVGARGAGGTGAAGIGGAGARGARGAGAGGARGAGAADARGDGDASAGGAGVEGARGAGAGGAGGTRATGAAGAGATGARGAGAGGSGGTGAGGVGDRVSCTTGSLAKRREPESRFASHDRTVSRACRPHPPPVPGMHIMALRPSSVPQRVALLSPLASSLPGVPEPESDLARAASPTITRLLATFVADPFLSLLLRLP